MNWKYDTSLYLHTCGDRREESALWTWTLHPAGSGDLQDNLFWTAQLMEFAFTFLM